jgi:inositol-hexakisphosphate kinase
MRRRAMKTAAEQKHGLTPLTPANPPTEAASEVQEGETGFDEKAGTSAPEPELPHEGDTQKGKRQRRYSSGGLRRKPSEVADDRGNLKYFEEADDAGYKGDVEEEVFAMDIGPSQTSSLPLRTAQNGQGPMIGAAKDDVEVAKPEMSKEIVTGIMLPPSRDEPTEATNQIDLPRPANPKEAQTQQGSRVEYFLLLEDLTTGMKRPCIMDLKMGTRQYGVEVNEKKQKSQRQKCAATTSKELGVRVCGLQVWDVKTQTYVFQDKYFGRDLKVGREFQNALMRFLYDGVDYSSVLRHIPTILSKLSQLEVIIRGLAGYRFYAASLLMFYDGDTGDDYESDSVATEKDMGHKRREIDFKIADFANCVVKETTRPTNPACPPRHPELPDLGFLRGLKSLRKYFLAIQEEIRQKEMGFTKEQINNVNGDLGFDGSEDDEGVISY